MVAFAWNILLELNNGVASGRNCLIAKCTLPRVFTSITSGHRNKRTSTKRLKAQFLLVLSTHAFLMKNSAARRSHGLRTFRAAVKNTNEAK